MTLSTKWTSKATILEAKWSAFTAANKLSPGAVARITQAIEFQVSLAEFLDGYASYHCVVGEWGKELRLKTKIRSLFVLVDMIEEMKDHLECRRMVQSVFWFAVAMSKEAQRLIEERQDSEKRSQDVRGGLSK